MGGLHWHRSWDPFRELQREMGRWFESFDPFTSTRSGRNDLPINVYDAEDRYVLTAQLPGLGPDDVELTMTGDTLTLRGERKMSEGITEDSFRRQERPIGCWTRTITLPDRVDSGRVTASFALGILTVTIPKAESAKARQIAVTTG